MRRSGPSPAKLGRNNYLLPPHFLPGMPRRGDAPLSQPTQADKTTCPPLTLPLSFLSGTSSNPFPPFSLVIQQTRAEAIWFIARRSSKMSTQTLKIEVQGLLYYRVYIVQLIQTVKISWHTQYFYHTKELVALFC